MKIRKTMAVWSLVAVVGALLTGCDNKEPSSPPVIVIEETKSFMPWGRHKVFKDCEDTGKTPCVTFDDGKWRKVLSYNPYASQVIRKPIKVKNGYKLR